MTTSTKGKVRTVLGLIDPSDLGVTLPHEHLFIDESIYFVSADEPTRKALARQPLGLENLGLVRFNPDINIDNLRLDDEDMMVKEVTRFKLAGGNTIVDGTPGYGLGRDIEALRRLSIRTGVNVIASAGYYVSIGHPKDMNSKTLDATLFSPCQR